MAPTAFTRTSRARIRAKLSWSPLNGGLRVYDIENPTDPVEIAHYLPETPDGQPAVQINDVFVDADHTVFITDRVNGGVYILQPEPWLSERMSAAYPKI